MKKIFLILGIFVMLFTIGLSVSAKTNQLHTITLDKNNGVYNIILDTDDISNVVRKVVSDNEIILELSGITSSDTINALYRGTDAIDNLVIENAGFNRLKIYVSAPNIKSSSVIMKPALGHASIVGEPFPWNKVLWSLFVLVISAVGIANVVNRTREENNLFIKHDIKEREIQMYKKYKRSFDEGINLYPKDIKMQNMLKKIDRRIDERLSVLSKK